VAALIAARRADGIPVAVACRALGVSESWFYKWKTARPGPRAQRRDRLKAEVARLFAEHAGKYGSSRITADLQDEGWRVSENTVADLMRELGLAARRKKRRKATIRPGKDRWRAPDLVKRDFGAMALNRRWFGDGTLIATDEGRLHLLVSVLDVASRRLLGFALGEPHDAALAMAVAVRGGQAPGVVFHTDRGSQGIHRGRHPGRVPAAFHHPVDWPSRLSITRSSSPGTPPWSPSSGRWSTSPPEPRPGPASAVLGRSWAWPCWWPGVLGGAGPGEAVVS
jgi:hypothetical protein